MLGMHKVMEQKMKAVFPYYKHTSAKTMDVYFDEDIKSIDISNLWLAANKGGGHSAGGHGEKQAASFSFSGKVLTITSSFEDLNVKTKDGLGYDYLLFSQNGAVVGSSGSVFGKYESALYLHVDEKLSPKGSSTTATVSSPPSQPIPPASGVKNGSSLGSSNSQALATLKIIDAPSLVEGEKKSLTLERTGDLSEGMSVQFGYYTSATISGGYADLSFDKAYFDANQKQTKVAISAINDQTKEGSETFYFYAYAQQSNGETIKSPNATISVTDAANSPDKISLGAEIRGGKGADKIKGTSTDDVIVGMEGVDTMTGRKGRDTFVITDTKWTDKITDFNLKDDKIAFTYDVLPLEEDHQSMVVTAIAFNKLAIKNNLDEDIEYIAVGKSSDFIDIDPSAELHIGIFTNKKAMVFDSDGNWQTKNDRTTLVSFGNKMKTSGWSSENFAFGYELDN